MPSADVERFADLILKARLPELPAGEMKWTKVSTAKLAAYKRVVDVFFSVKAPAFPHFHSLIVDTTKQDHHTFNHGSREVGFNKEVFQLARKFGLLYGGHLFHLYLDRRSTDQKTEDLRLMLNRNLASRGDDRDWPYRRLQFRDSKAVQMIQLVDVFTGAIAYQMNEHHLEFFASPAKCQLSAYILEQAKITDISIDTARRGRFTVWHRVLKERVL